MPLDDGTFDVRYSTDHFLTWLGFNMNPLQCPVCLNNVATKFEYLGHRPHCIALNTICKIYMAPENLGYSKSFSPIFPDRHQTSCILDNCSFTFTKLEEYIKHLGRIHDKTVSNVLYTIKFVITSSRASFCSSLQFTLHYKTILSNYVAYFSGTRRVCLNS